MPDLPEDIVSKIQELEFAVESQPTAEAFAQLADLYRTNGQLERATEVCEQALKQFSKDIKCLMTYARVLADSGLLEEAESTLKCIIELGGEEAGTLIMLGQLYVQRNDMAGIHSIASKLQKDFPDDVRAKKFLGFLNSRNLLPAGIKSDINKARKQEVKVTQPVKSESETIQLSDTTNDKPVVVSPEVVSAGGVDVSAAPDEKATPETAPESAKTESEIPTPKKTAPPKRRRPTQIKKAITTISMDDMMHIIARLNGIVGVQHVVLTDPGNKTMASKGCPNMIAKAIGGLIRSLKRAMPIAFEALQFGNWTKGVVEIEKITIHLIAIEGYWVALLCDKTVSLGALRIAVNSIIKREMRIGRI